MHKKTRESAAENPSSHRQSLLGLMNENSRQDKDDQKSQTAYEGLLRNLLRKRSKGSLDFEEFESRVMLKVEVHAISPLNPIHEAGSQRHLVRNIFSGLNPVIRLACIDQYMREKPFFISLDLTDPYRQA
jgi:hypothetical protein